MAVLPLSRSLFLELQPLVRVAAVEVLEVQVGTHSR